MKGQYYNNWTYFNRNSLFSKIRTKIIITILDRKGLCTRFESEYGYHDLASISRKIASNNLETNPWNPSENFKYFESCKTLKKNQKGSIIFQMWFSNYRW